MALVDDLTDNTELGHVVDLELEGQLFTFATDRLVDGRPRGPVLVWSENKQALFWFTGVRTPRARALTDDDSPAGDVWRQWTRGREPSTQRTFNVEPSGRPAVLRPRAVAIRYLSDKFNKRSVWVLYKHHFDEGLKLTVQGDERGVKLYMVRGGRLRITPDGIEG